MSIYLHVLSHEKPRLDQNLININTDVTSDPLCTCEVPGKRTNPYLQNGECLSIIIIIIIITLIVVVIVDVVFILVVIIISFN